MQSNCLGIFEEGFSLPCNVSKSMIDVHDYGGYLAEVQKFGEGGQIISDIH